MRSCRLLLILVCIVPACTEFTDSAPPGKLPVDSGFDGLFADYLYGGLFDEDGHPLDAQVFSARTDCAPNTGEERGRGWGAVAELHQAGSLCSTVSEPIAGGRFLVNLKALIEQSPEFDDQAPEVFTLRVTDQDGSELASRTVTAQVFREPMTYQHFSLEINVWSSQPVHLHLNWSGQVSFRFEYLEVFRATRRMAVFPASGIYDPQSDFVIEALVAPGDTVLKLHSNTDDLGERLNELISEGRASDLRTEFSRVLSAPLGELLDGSQSPRWVLAELNSSNAFYSERREVLYLDQPPPCTFDPQKEIRVLLTAFVPFPPNPWDRSDAANSSKLAVENFDPEVLDHAQKISVMKLMLPVEYDSASRLVQDVVRRCDPHLAISFGQGRSQVELEILAYNLKDTSSVSGGVPDNRGTVYSHEPISADGPETFATRLPVLAIIDRLKQSGISARRSSDPGRYVCNDVFYGLMRAIGPEKTAGFIHIPRVWSPDQEDLDRLARVVEAAVDQSVKAHLGILETDPCQDDLYEPNDSPEQGSSISELVEEELQICRNELGEEDWFRVQLNEGDSLQVEILFAHDDADLDLMLYRENHYDTALIESMSSTDNERISYTGDAGVYYIRVHPWRLADVAYRMSVTID